MLGFARVTSIFSSVLIASSLVVLAAGCDKGQNVKLDNDRSKASYGIGFMVVGPDMKRNGLDVDVDAFAMGIRDAVAAKEGKLKPEEIQAAMNKMREELTNKQKAVAEQAQKDGETFLAENKKKDGWKATASGLQFKVIDEGTGASPKASEWVKVHYVGTLTNGTKFDSSRDRGEPAVFPVQGVIPGWVEALQLMKKGAKWNLVIPSNLAYGPQAQDKIPANSVLMFEVELIEFGTQDSLAAKPAAPAQPAAADKKSDKKK